MAAVYLLTVSARDSTAEDHTQSTVFVAAVVASLEHFSQPHLWAVEVGTSGEMVGPTLFPVTFRP